MAVGARAAVVAVAAAAAAAAVQVPKMSEGWMEELRSDGRTAGRAEAGPHGSVAAAAADDDGDIGAGHCLSHNPHPWQTARCHSLRWLVKWRPSPSLSLSLPPGQSPSHLHLHQTCPQRRSWEDLSDGPLCCCNLNGGSSGPAPCMD